MAKFSKSCLFVFDSLCYLGCSGDDPRVFDKLVL